MNILKGAVVSAAVKEELLQKKEELKNDIPTLAIIRVGEKADDISYEKGATKKMESLGIRVESHVFPEDISDEAFKEAFCRINEDENVDGLLVLRPLPPQICEKDLEKMIDPEKDVDGIGMENMSKVYAGDLSGYAPCTAQAVMEMIRYLQIPLEGKRVAILGRSLVLGKPLTMLLMKENATVTVCHTRTQNVQQICREAEIVIAAMGSPKAIKKEYLGENAIVIDVGVNVDEEGKLCGDVDFDDVKDVAHIITPVPGGVGAVTTTVLAKHVIESALKKKDRIYEKTV